MNDALNFFDGVYDIPWQNISDVSMIDLIYAEIH